MKLNRLFICAAAMAVLFTGCKKEDAEDTAAASITVNGSKAVELSFDKTASQQTVTIVSNRPWKLSDLSSWAKAWITVSGADGTQETTSGKTVTIAVSQNTGVARSYDLSFTNGTATATVSVKQAIGDIKTITIADFIAKADTVNSYAVKGTVTEKSEAEKYWGISIKDSTGTLSCPFPYNWNEYKDSIEVGSVVTICGPYEYYLAKSLHEMNSGTIISVEAGAPEKGVIYSETFAKGFGKWTRDNKVMPSGVDSIWALNPSYNCILATGYYNSTNYAVEGWLISPVIDMTSKTAAFLEYNQAVNFFSTLDKAKEECVPMIREEGGSWTALTVTNWPSSMSWNLINTGSIDISSYAGKKIQLALKYTSTQTKAGSWEVQNLKITEEKQKPAVDDFDADLTWVIDSVKTQFTTETDDTYKDGYYISRDNIKLGFYKNTSSAAPVAPTDLMKIYKNYIFKINSSVKTIKAIRLTASATNVCVALTPVSPSTLNCTLNTTALTIKVVGESKDYILQATAGKIFASKIEFDFVGE